MLAGSDINRGTPIPATIAFNLENEDAWILGAKDGGYLKMVKIRVTGSSSYDWIETKYSSDGSYDESCETSFTASCFGGSHPGGQKIYVVPLVARAFGILFQIFLYRIASYGLISISLPLT